MLNIKNNGIIRDFLLPLPIKIYVMGKERYFIHFKGGLYKMLGVACHSETLEQVVVYQALYDSNKIWVRPFDMFFDKITLNGILVERFKEITKEEMLCQLQKQKENT